MKQTLLWLSAIDCYADEAGFRCRRSQWPLLERGSSDQSKFKYVVSAIMSEVRSGVPSTKAAAQ